MSKTVLVVEDNAELLEVVDAILKDDGWRVFTTEDSTDALPLLKQYGENLALLLTDVVLPGISGVELAARAKDAYPQIKILLMTGYSDVETGTLPVLRKPFRRKELMDAITRVMANERLGRWC